MKVTDITYSKEANLLTIGNIVVYNVKEFHLNKIRNTDSGYQNTEQETVTIIFNDNSQTEIKVQPNKWNATWENKRMLFKPYNIDDITYKKKKNSIIHKWITKITQKITKIITQNNTKPEVIKYQWTNYNNEL